jgi:uncharacterized caspase-like protein
MRVQFLLVAVLVIAVGCQPSGTEPMAKLAEDQPAPERQVPDVAMRGSPAVGVDEATGDGAAFQAAPQAEPADQPPVIDDLSGTRGARPLESTSDAPSGEDAFDYQNKWALIVGINYAGHPVLPQLGSAERDAEAVYKQLVTNYGYRPDETAFLLLGRADTPERRATKNSIEERLRHIVNGTFGERRDGAWAEKRTKKDNSILFYFAGHGDFLPEGGREVGQLYPVDTEVLPDGSIDTAASVVDFTFITRILRQSIAHHKIVILDCCRSGLLFETPAFGPTYRSGDRPNWRDLARDTIVGITAGTRDEKVPDVGSLREGHSPFTGALLEVLDTPRTTPLPAERLYAAIHDRFENYNKLAASKDLQPIAQKPRYGRQPLADAADFYFIPSRDSQRQTARSTEREPPSTNDAEPLAVAFATFPGLTGRRWWFEEVPWMLPELRREPRHLHAPTVYRPIDGQVSRHADMLATMDPASLRGVLFESFERYQEELRTRERQWRRAGSVASLEEDIRESLADPAKRDELLAEVESFGDLHLLALVQHRFKRPEAHTTYEEALARYVAATEATPARRCLYAVCLADIGRLQADNNAWRESAGSFRRARHQVAGLGPSGRARVVVGQHRRQRRIGPSSGRRCLQVRDQHRSNSSVVGIPIRQVIQDLAIPLPVATTLALAGIAERIPDRQAEHHPLDPGKIKVCRQGSRILIEDRPENQPAPVIAEQSLQNLAVRRHCGRRTRCRQSRRCLASSNAPFPRSLPNRRLSTTIRLNRI